MSSLNLSPDWYTKILLDPQGNVLNADYLTEDDLPNHTHDLSEITGDLKGKITEVLKSFFANNMDNAVVFHFDEKTGTVTADLRYDGLTLDKNEDGELYCSVSGGEGGSGPVVPECATHTHLHTAIEDWDEAIEDALKRNQKPVDLRGAIDNTTIVINENGKLAAIGVGIVEHKHTIDDIVDFPEIIPAAQQYLHPEDFPAVEGPIDFTDLTIGHSILAINYYLATQDVRLDNLAGQISRIAMTSSNANAQAVFKVKEDAAFKELYNTVTKKFKDVYLNNKLSLVLDSLPYNDCKISMLVDGKAIETVNSIGLAVGTAKGHFLCTNTVQKGTAGSKVIEYSLRDISEGYHTFQLEYDLGSVKDYSCQLGIEICNLPEFDLRLIDANPVHEKGGVEYYDYPFEHRVILKAMNLDDTIYRDLDLGLDDWGEKLLNLEKDTLTVENLFKITSLNNPCNKKVEHSTSFVSKTAALIYGVILDDIFYPDVRGSMSFEIPNSERCNGLEIRGLPSNGIVAVELIKNGNRVSSNELFNACDPNNKGGLIETDKNNSIILSFNQIYDDGKNNIGVLIDTTVPINTQSLVFNPL